MHIYPFRVCQFQYFLDDDFLELKDFVIKFIPDNLHSHFDTLALKYSFTR